MNILVLNIGSSSLKARLCSMSDRASRWEAKADWGRHPHQADIQYRVNGQSQEESREIQAPEDLFEAVLRAVPAGVDMIGHRIVHGNGHFSEAVRVTEEVKQAIRDCAIFAPVHNRLELAGIEAAERIFDAQVPQVAVFDTAFHSTMPAAAYTYPGPYSWLDQGIRRYGFHGISHRYIAGRVASLLNRDLSQIRLVSCHLGNGCSLAAIAGGKSIDTTMGFTPLDGLMMGTRSGSVDPGILIHLLREEHCSPDDLDRILNKESGLKGLSGISGDAREIHTAIDQSNARAQLAFDVFVHRLVREIGGMAAVLGGLDALAFAGGIGENDVRLRAKVSEKLRFLGVQPDEAANLAGPAEDADISAQSAAVRTLIVHTQEEWQIAEECFELLT